MPSMPASQPWAQGKIGGAERARKEDRSMHGQGPRLLSGPVCKKGKNDAVAEAVSSSSATAALLPHLCRRPPGKSRPLLPPRSFAPPHTSMPSPTPSLKTKGFFCLLCSANLIQYYAATHLDDLPHAQPEGEGLLVALVEHLAVGLEAPHVAHRHALAGLGQLALGVAVRHLLDLGAGGEGVRVVLGREA